LENATSREVHQDSKVVPWNAPLFGTYVREAAFSTMNTIKSRMRNRLDNSSLDLCLSLSLTGLPNDIDKLSAQKQAQSSH
jgi:hypothetical protein